MSIKGLFGQKYNENKTINIEEFEQQIRRINTLEVHVNRLLKLETKIGPITSLKGRMKSENKSTMEQNTEDEILSQINSLKLKLDNLTQKVNSTEYISFQRHEKQNNQSYFSLGSQAEKNTRNDSNKHIERYIDNMIEQKLSPFLKHAEYCNEKLITLEKNIALINEIQLDMLKRAAVIQEQLSELREQPVKDGDTDSKQTIVLKELYIDKFFLDKYEQNNNIAQIGIKELSGALNIGATYGNAALPGEASAEFKKEMEEHKLKSKTAKKEAEETTSSEESSSDSSPTGEIFYTDIPIEDPMGDDNN